ncbi:hypothetical protein BLNAU_18080 [Blattamonas nauphoetae]|uniref:PB1 domain-containing protein n=1 Tax=Blattamonas nauphoetae TaxID=2049346 RepID=A0ABQ9X5E4_9EUKA|nr:hypothetical protein BLNAU_18080 [Blattamonas nauphoetae]
MASVVIKVTLNATTDTRRLEFSEAPSYGLFLKHLNTVFELNPDAPIALSYIDDEEDKITVACDADLVAALHFASTNPPLKLNLSTKAAQSPPTPYNHSPHHPHVQHPPPHPFPPPGPPPHPPQFHPPHPNPFVNHPMSYESFNQIPVFRTRTLHEFIRSRNELARDHDDPVQMREEMWEKQMRKRMRKEQRRGRKRHSYHPPGVPPIYQNQFGCPWSYGPPQPPRPPINQFPPPHPPPQMQPFEEGDQSDDPSSTGSGGDKDPFEGLEQEKSSTPSNFCPFIGMTPWIEQEVSYATQFVEPIIQKNLEMWTRFLQNDRQTSEKPQTERKGGKKGHK